MTLFLNSLFFLILNDIFSINFYFLLILYIVYIIIYILKINRVSYIYIKNIKLMVNIFKFNFYTNTLYTYIKTYLNFFLRGGLVWKPLFKKSSYFGLYRSNRNQWLNK